MGTKITENFDLDEFVYSQTAVRKGIRNVPSTTCKGNIIALAENVMQPLRTIIGRSITITSGFRCATLNRAVGGASTSQHVCGEACDFQVGSLASLKDSVISLLTNGIVFDQLILERFDRGNAAWVHVSFKRSGENRNQILTFYGRKYTGVNRAKALQICGYAETGQNTGSTTPAQPKSDTESQTQPDSVETNPTPFRDAKEEKEKMLKEKINQAFGLKD